MENQTCTRCVMDSTAAGIEFDADGVCNYCTSFLTDSARFLNMTAEQRSQGLNDLVARAKSEGRGKRYDCIIGVSGGVDSSWALVKAVECGLRPLAVHMDNGWNSELAQNNIANLVRKLDVDLYTHVIDWVEYRQLMQAFFDANVIDIELLYDNAMLAVNYQQAERHGVRFILAGTNQATEGMRFPPNWNWFKYDKTNIKNIAKKFGAQKLASFPSIGTINFVNFEFIKKIKWISFLDYFEFDKKEAMATLAAEYGYKPYPYKHYESVFTRFYQGYLLPQKFGVDKRKIHFSTLICSAQMRREDAVEDLRGLPYPSERDLEHDRAYFLKKMNWTEAQLSNYLAQPEVAHSVYGTEKPLWDFLLGIYRKHIKKRLG